MRLQIDAEGKGEITFGEGTLAPLPEDPTVGYICELDDLECGRTPEEGFPYRTVKATLEGRRVGFTVLTAEPWDAWCAMQTPVATEENECRFALYDDTRYTHTSTPEGCLLGDGTADPVLVNCDWLALATVCQCSGERCYAGPGYTVAFELTLSANGQQMTGSYAVWMNSQVATSYVELRRD